MAKFMSGPPGGRTLPLTPTRLSDMDGGVYGPGASVASTGMNGQRPAIRAFRAHAAGETWEDILEYYIVRFLPHPHRTLSLSLFSSPSPSLTKPKTVPSRPRRNRLCLPTRQDLLPRQHLRRAGWCRLRRRRRRAHSTRFRTRVLLLLAHSAPNMAHRPRRPALAPLSGARGGRGAGRVRSGSGGVSGADVFEGGGAEAGRGEGEDVV